MSDSTKWSWSSRLVPWLLPIVLIAGWQGASLAGWLPGNVVPSPFSVLLAGLHLAQTGELAVHLGESFQRAMIGLFIGGSIGFVLGLMNGLFTMSNRILDSSLQMIRNIPHLALIPLVIRWLEMQNLIEKLWQQRGFTAILVTHDVEEAVALADRVLLMQHGKFRHESLVSLSRPRDRAGAEFAALKTEILSRVLAV